MHKEKLKNVLLASITILFFSACTNSAAPNPNSGTQTGAAIGALAGSVIGYNSAGHHSRGSGAIVGGLLGAAVGAGVGNAVDSSNPPPVNHGGWQ